MPRFRRNFKFRPAKFLGARHTKYETTGTYTGAYRGPPVSQRRIAIRNRPRQTYKGPNLDYINSPVSRSSPFESRSAAQNSGVFLFRNTRTNQVVYSLKGHLEPEKLLPQLTFYGKKSVPNKYRRDDWRPMAAVSFAHGPGSKEKTLLCYWYLRDLRMLRDYAWHEKGAPALPKKLRTKTQLLHDKSEASDASSEKKLTGADLDLSNKKKPPTRYPRAAKLMNQLPAAVCDVCTAIEKISNGIPHSQLERLVQWKVVEDLASEASYGALTVLGKQLARAQRVLNSESREKKFPNAKSRALLQEQMKIWYRQQSMYLKAVEAQRLVQEADNAGQILAKSASKGAAAATSLKHSYARKLMAFSSREKFSSTMIEHPAFTVAHGINKFTSFRALREEMMWYKYWQHFPGELQHVGKLLRLISCEKSLAALEAQAAKAKTNEALQTTDASKTDKERLELRAQREYYAGQCFVAEVQRSIKELVKLEPKPVGIAPVRSKRAKRMRAKARQEGSEPEEPKPPIAATIYWTSITDRKYNSDWPEYVKHSSIAAATHGQKAYFRHPRSLLYDAQISNVSELIGNEDNEVAEAVENEAPAVQKPEYKPAQAFSEYIQTAGAEQQSLREHYWNFIDTVTQQQTAKPAETADGAGVHTHMLEQTQTQGATEFKEA